MFYLYFIRKMYGFFSVWLYLASSVVFLSCGNKQDDAPVRLTEITLSADTLFAASTGFNTVTVSVKDKSLLGELHVKKQDSRGRMLHQIVPADAFEDHFLFEYTPLENDDEQFNFIFEAQAKDGTVIATAILKADTREGILLDGLTMISRVTGKSLNGEGLPNPNRTDENYNVGGTDLGIVWDMENGMYGMFFGDTYGRDFTPQPNGGPSGGYWRSNVLAFSHDTDLDDGLAFSGMATDGNGAAREIAYSAKNTSGNGDYTSIPTAAIRAGGMDYLHYMNIRTWDGWLTNFSSLYASADNGSTWQRCENVRFLSDSNFGQVCYARKDGYVYMIGTPPGRAGSGKLARIPENEMLNMEAYEYWNEQQGWIKTESAASVIFEGTVGEASLMYHKGFNRWIVTYFDSEKYALMYRDAAEITGVWTKEKTLATGVSYPQLYGSFMHPAKDSDARLYFLMSQWKPYNVFLMRADMKLKE
ncbi:MAG: DUF4185 domain-containing protein [Bacteroidales bacterium]|jgi:hypothetical protein|nr:DUF4185 domain-containing protein [Bacteroidales bacterium]